MKILLVNKYWYARGGAEVVAMSTKKLLDEAGHETAVFSMRHSQNEIDHPLFPQEMDYQKDSFSKKIKNSLKTLNNKEAKQLFEKMILEFKPDVVHFHNIYHQLSFSLLEITKKYKIRSVMTLHDYKLLSPNYSLYHHGKIDRSILGKKYYRCLLKNCMESVPESFIATLEVYYRHFKKYHSLVDVYISPSEFLKHLFEEAGWEKNSIEVIRNPVEIPKIFKSKERVGDPFVAYIGRLSGEKGIEVLLRAAQLLPKIPFSIVGTGPGSNHLRSLAIHKRINNVTFYGWKTGKELQEFYSNARVLVVPSVWFENYPLGILEAKANAKIIIASHVGGIPEMLSNEFLFEMGNEQELATKIEKWFSSSEAKRFEIGKIFQNEVKKENDPKEYLEKLLKVYLK